MSIVREKLGSQRLSPATNDIILSSWRDGTKSQYQSSIQKWTTYCREKGINALSPHLSEALDFLSSLYHSGSSYSSINTARTAHSSVLQLINVGTA